MFEIGRLCRKIAGRDAGKKCVVVSKEKDGRVLIDGETRRRQCNTLHLEPLAETISLKEGASRVDVKSAFKKLGIELADSKPKKAKERPRHVRKRKEKPTQKKSLEKKADPLPKPAEKKEVSKKDESKGPEKPAPKKAEHKPAKKAVAKKTGK